MTQASGDSASAERRDGNSAQRRHPACAPRGRRRWYPGSSTRRSHPAADRQRTSRPPGSSTWHTSAQHRAPGLTFRTRCWNRCRGSGVVGWCDGTDRVERLREMDEEREHGVRDDSVGVNLQGRGGHDHSMSRPNAAGRHSFPDPFSHPCLPWPAGRRRSALHSSVTDAIIVIGFRFAPDSTPDRERGQSYLPG